MERTSTQSQLSFTFFFLFLIFIFFKKTFLLSFLFFFFVPLPEIWQKIKKLAYELETEMLHYPPDLKDLEGLAVAGSLVQNKNDWKHLAEGKTARDVAEVILEKLQK